jgi:hypothetical protein
MTMCYLWGLGIGHQYAHSDAPKARETHVLQPNLNPLSIQPPFPSPSIGLIQAEAPAKAIPQYNTQEAEDMTCDHSTGGQEREYELADREEADQNWYSDEEEENTSHRVQEPESETDD